MKKQADYIKRIEIKRLWGRKDISWELRPDVNILSGVNGIGKSTILNRSVNSLSALHRGYILFFLLKMLRKFILMLSEVLTDH